MPPTVDLTTAPPVAPPDAAVPPVDVQPRTERVDWIFVGYPWGQYVKRNDRQPAIYVADRAEVDAGVAVWGSRDGAYPFIWLAPELAQEFEDAMTEVLTRNFTAPMPPAALGATLDFTRYDAVRADNAKRRAAGGAAPDEAAEEDAGARVHEALAALGLGDDEPFEDARFRPDEWPLRHGTVRAIVEAHCRAKAHGALYDHKHWYVLLRPSPEEEARLKREDQPYLKAVAAGGAGDVYMRQDLDYRALAERHVLPVAAARLVAFLRAWHETADDKARAHTDYGECGAFPSDRTVAKWLADQQVEDPPASRPTSPPPDARLADAIADAVDDLFHRPRSHADGPTAEQIRRRVRKNREEVAAALEWLVAERKLVKSEPGAHGRVGYLPPVDER